MKLRLHEMLGWLCLFVVILSTISCARNPSAEILSTLIPVCDRQGVQQAAEYDLSIPKIHPIVVLAQDGQVHEFTYKVPSEWSPRSLDEVELVLCLGKVSLFRKHCRYSGGKTIYFAKEYLYFDLREAKTGAVVTSIDRFMSGQETDCPVFVLSTESDIEAKITWEDIQRKLEFYVDSREK